jgi:hypothetical protein
MNCAYEGNVGNEGRIANMTHLYVSTLFIFPLLSSFLFKKLATKQPIVREHSIF